MEKNKKIFMYCLVTAIAGFLVVSVSGCAVTSKTSFKGEDSKLTIGTGLGVNAGGEISYSNE